jgi:DNA invertase Pin-like site-specific DNA recombinase
VTETWGYARVSTEDQELGSQVTALLAAGVPAANIVAEKASGTAGLPGRSTPLCWRA